MANRKEPKPTAQARLLGFLRYRLSQTARFWVRVDLDSFADMTGLTKRTAERALAALRAQGCGLDFRTVWRHLPGRKGHWIVICADPGRLDFDREPLFRSDDDRPRHVRPALRLPTITPRCNRHPYKGGFSSGKSAVERLCRPKSMSIDGLRRLERKAAAIADRLERTHWDNCKVDFERGPAWRWVLAALADSQPERRIAAAYDTALHRLHGTATDRGERFGLASTLHRAQRWMDAQPRNRDFTRFKPVTDVTDIHRFEPIRWEKRSP